MHTEKTSKRFSFSEKKYCLLQILSYLLSYWIVDDMENVRFYPRIRYLPPPPPPPLVKMDQQRTALWLVEQLRTALWLVSSLAASYYVVRARQFQAATARTRRARGSCSYKLDCTDRRFNSQLLPIKGLGAFPWSDGGPTLGLGASGKWMMVAILTILGWSSWPSFTYL